MVCVTSCWITSLPPTVAPGISDTGRTLNSTRLLPLKDFCIYKKKVNIGGGSGLHNDWRRGRGKRRMAQVRSVVCYSFFNLHLLPWILFIRFLCFSSRIHVDTSVLLHLHLLPMNSLVFSFRLDCDGTSVVLYLPMNSLLSSWIEYAICSTCHQVQVPCHMWIHQSFFIFLFFLSILFFPPGLNMHLGMFNMSPGTSGQKNMGQLSSSLNTGSCVVYGLNLISF